MRRTLPHTRYAEWPQKPTLGNPCRPFRPAVQVPQPAWSARLAEREAQRLAAIRAQLSTAKRKKAWSLADGTRTQRDIAKAAGMDEGGASRFFKTLRDLKAVADGPNPKKVLDVEVE